MAVSLNLGVSLLQGEKFSFLRTGGLVGFKSQQLVNVCY
jgi:hypothetical protein